MNPRKCKRCGKTIYRSERAANKKVMELRSDRIMAVNGERIPLRPYYEAACGWWHLTSQPKRSAAAKIKTDI